MYILIDDQFRVYQTPEVTEYQWLQATNGNLSILDLDDMTGLNVDGTWDDIQEWDSAWTIESQPLVSV